MIVIIIIKMAENRKESGERSDICHHITYHHKEDKLQPTPCAFIHPWFFRVGFCKGFFNELFSNLLPCL
jgi:ferredoxin-thioredoxin reductase catalytic subunit